MILSHYVPVIKAVGDACNLRCGYCFYSGCNQRMIGVMNTDLLKAFFQQYFKLFSGNLKFIWHGGEPLLAGIKFYENAVRLQNKFRKGSDAVKNVIQTNATLITSEWASFFKCEDFGVGVSLDGCRKNHNRHRRDAAGRGTFNRVLRGIAELRRQGIKPGIIQTVTRSGVDSFPEDFHFFSSSLKVNGWAVNLYAKGSSRKSKLANESLRNRDVSKIYSSIVREWLNCNDADLRLREIENFVAGAMGRRADTCSFNGTCANYFCLDAKGLIWPCDRLSGDTRFLLGDLRKQSLQEILSGKAANNHIVHAKQLTDDCLPCRWRNACNNGCTAMRNPATKKYVYCASRLKMFSAVEALLSSHRDGITPAVPAK